jgi:DNA-binding Xre family transcriptional regulator
MCIRERGIVVGTNYNKLWHLLIDRGMKKRELCEKAALSTSSLAKLGKGENVNTETLVKICRALNCGVNDIMEIIIDEENAK